MACVMSSCEQVHIAPRLYVFLQRLVILGIVRSKAGDKQINNMTLFITKNLDYIMKDVNPR